MKRWPMVVLAAAALWGCATTRSSQAPAADSGSEVASEDKGRLVCRRERVVGSHRKQRICQYQGDRDRERSASQEGFGKSRSGAPAANEGPVM